MRATGGPGFAASVSSPAMTQGAVALLQNSLTAEENALWVSLGPNWTHQKYMMQNYKKLEICPFNTVCAHADVWLT